MIGSWSSVWPGPPSGSPFGAPHYWGETHLALDAIVAYVDDELSQGARCRAQDHLSRCRDCGAEVAAQYQARTAVRAAATPSAPSSLLLALRSIPQDAELPEPPAGLSIGADGQFGILLRDQPPRMNPPMAGPTAAQLMAPMTAPSGAPAGRRSATSRRVRFGAGVMVSGLALGALVVGATPSPNGAAGTGSPGAARSAVDAQLQLGGVNDQRVAPSATPASTLAPVRR
jgi:anti-sigma factor RsiW